VSVFAQDFTTERVKQKRMYISGPMTGIDQWNFPLFWEAEGYWQEMGWEVFNPANNFDSETGHPRKEYLRIDFAQVIESDALCALPHWNRSRGATMEVAIAHELELPIYEWRSKEISDAHYWIQLCTMSAEWDLIR
jgi:hypothetical protein